MARNSAFLFNLSHNFIGLGLTQSKPLISIENAVASATIDQRLDLKDIAKKMLMQKYSLIV